MAKRKDTAERPRRAKRPAKEWRERFAWTGDDILHLEVDGQLVVSTPVED